MKFKAIVLLLPLVMSCNNSTPSSKEADVKQEVLEVERLLTKADSIVNSSVEFHGGVKYDEASYTFSFRGRQYGFKNAGDQYKYILKKEYKGDTIEDEMTNTSFTRKVNGELAEVPDSMAAKYGNSLNSVIYFATLPHKLKDPAVIKSYKGSVNIKGIEYDKVEIRFEQEGGGTDHDDVYMYWFRKDNHAMDYLAYLYHVNEGGVRFRSSYNRRKIKGIAFQDYINYKAPIGTPLDELPQLFEKEELEELSRIETENVSPTL